MCAIKSFRVAFRRARREISKASGRGFGFSVPAECMKEVFRDFMIEAHVPATAQRLAMVDTWVSRASRLGGAA